MDFASTSPTLLTWSFIQSRAALNYYRRDNVLIILQPLCTADVKFPANLFLEVLWGWGLYDNDNLLPTGKNTIKKHNIFKQACE